MVLLYIFSVLFQNKTLLVSFLYSGGSSEMFHMQDVEVDPKTATWLCYTMPSKLQLSTVMLVCMLLCVYSWVLTF